MEDHDWQIDADLSSDKEVDEDEDIDTSIKDLEFRVMHDLTQVQNQCNSSRSFTLKEINILKVILCSGLYPQLAVSDEFNSFKRDTEQTFHTKNKGFVLLHPTSVFASDAGVLQPNVVKEHENSTKDTRLKGCISNNHQLLAFVSLLETNKPYLTGAMRVPALQILLLFSCSIDTDSSCLRLVFDCWLEACLYITEEEAEDLISNMVRLRLTWHQLLELKLKVQELERTSDDGDKKRLSSMANTMQKFLSQKIAEFLECDISYTLRRILPAEAANMYFAQPQGEENELLQGSCPPHPVKGGIQVNPYLVLQCIEASEDSVFGEYSTITQKHWTCSKCKDSMIATLAERLLHEQQCYAQDRSGVYSYGTETSEDKEKSNALKKSYHCKNCGDQFMFTTVEILKHRKTCKETT